MYLDLNSNVTCGVGHLLARSQDASILRFRRMSDKRLATPQQIIDVWSKLRYQSGTPKTEYDKSLYLLEADIEALMMQDLARFQPIMDKTFPAFDSYPQDAQCALWDMIWELGSFVKFPKFVAAVKALNWEEAARQCYRPQASPTRNKDTQDLLLSAVPAIHT